MEIEFMQSKGTVSKVRSNMSEKQPENIKEHHYDPMLMKTILCFYIAGM